MASITKIFAGATTTSTSSIKEVGRFPKTFQAVQTGTGTQTATVVIYGGHFADDTKTTMVSLATLGLSGTTTATDGVLISSPWPYIICEITAMSGTSAALTLSMGQY